jgi:methylmalonyl-CoA mutase N-terminal domain/subunit
VSTKPPIAKNAERRARFETSSGIELPADCNPSNTVPPDYAQDLGAPGEFPYTRGVRANMYRGRFWTMRQYAGYASAEESNARYKYLLAHGTTGLSVAFDLPTQIGLDSDDPLASGEVGKVGVAIDSIEDMERLFDSIPLGEVSTSMTINATAAILLCLYIAVARRQGVAGERLNGTIQNDIFKEYIARGTYIIRPRPACVSSRTRSPSARAKSRTGTRFRLAAITYAKPVRPPRRKSPSPSPTPSLTPKPRLPPG